VFDRRIILNLVVIIAATEVCGLAIYCSTSQLRAIRWFLTVLTTAFLVIKPQLAMTAAERASTEVTSVEARHTSLPGIVELRYDNQIYAADAATMIVFEGYVIFEALRSHFSIPSQLRAKDESSNRFEPEFIFETEAAGISVRFRSSLLQSYETFSQTEKQLRAHATGAYLQSPLSPTYRA
jgi:hypothetical protein